MSSPVRDFYAILGVPRDADASAITKAYRSLAMRWHPDKNPGNVAEAQSRFQEICEAYEALSDPEKRAAYDRYGEQGLRPGGDPAAPRFRRPDDIFSAFFGFGSPFGRATFYAQGPRRLDPATVSISCSLEQLFAGAAKDIRYTRTRNGEQDEALLHIVIPPGTRGGAEFEFPGEGELLPGYIPQDVVLVVKELAHTRFTRAGDDLATRWRSR
jgi:DnaJ-class molecular chaperone